MSIFNKQQKVVIVDIGLYFRKDKFALSLKCLALNFNCCFQFAAISK